MNVFAGTMCSVMSSFVTFVLLLCLSALPARCQRYIVPEATLEFLSPRGLKISIPDDDKDIKLVAFHININEEFDSLTHGQWAQDIIKKRDGRWSYNIPDFKVKQGDSIYYWIYVVVDKLAYHGLDRVFKVTQPEPHKVTGDRVDPSKPPPSITPDREEGPSCQLSLTSRNQGMSACRGEVILNKQFDSMNGWDAEVFIGSTKPEDEFTVFTKDSSVSFVEDGNFVIKPILLEEKYDDTFVRSGNLTLDGCTSRIADECSKQAFTYLILPPVMSARYTTKRSFSFRYGTVEIRAKLPRGDWIVPELWLEPKRRLYGDRSGRIVLGLSRGNTDSRLVDSNWLLEAGVVLNTTSQLGKQTLDTEWSADYHIFKLVWSEEMMVFSVDNKEITRITSYNGALDPFLESGKLAPFDKEFYLTLGVHVAGGKDFPDGTQDKPWKNSDPKRFVKFWDAKGSWHQTWNKDSSLRVKSVKVTAL